MMQAGEFPLPFFMLMAKNTPAVRLQLTDLPEWFILMWFVKVVKNENSCFVHNLFKANRYNVKEG